MRAKASKKFYIFAFTQNSSHENHKDVTRCGESQANVGGKSFGDFKETVIRWAMAVVVRVSLTKMRCVNKVCVRVIRSATTVCLLE